MPYEDLGWGAALQAITPWVYAAIAGREQERLKQQERELARQKLLAEYLTKTLPERELFRRVTPPPITAGITLPEEQVPVTTRPPTTITEIPLTVTEELGLVESVIRGKPLPTDIITKPRVPPTPEKVYGVIGPEGLVTYKGLSARPIVLRTTAQELQEKKYEYGKKKDKQAVWRWAYSQATREELTPGLISVDEATRRRVEERAAELYEKITGEKLSPSEKEDPLGLGLWSK